MDIGIKLTKLREDLNLTRIIVAKDLNIKYTTYSKYETGERTPNNNTLVKISNYFNVATDYLLGNNNVLNNHIKDANGEYDSTEKDNSIIISTEGLSDDDITLIKNLAEKLRHV